MTAERIEEAASDWCDHYDDQRGTRSHRSFLISVSRGEWLVTATRNTSAGRSGFGEETSDLKQGRGPDILAAIANALGLEET